MVETDWSLDLRLRGETDWGLKLALFWVLNIKRDSEEMEVLMSRPRGIFLPRAGDHNSLDGSLLWWFFILPLSLSL